MSRRRLELPPTSPWMLRWFTGYVPRYLRKQFGVVRLLGDPPDTATDRPILVYCNHPSWWDPLVIVLLISRYFRHRPGYGPIDVKGLQRYRFLERLGFFGIDLETRQGAQHFLELGTTVLTTPGQTLWVTAEGRFTDARKRPVELRRGIAHLARSVARSMTAQEQTAGGGGASGGVALPLAVEYVFGPEKKPELRLAFGEPIALSDASRSVDEWHRVLNAALEATMDRLAAAGVALQAEVPGDAERLGFSTLLDGQAGVGGVYGLWQWIKSRVGGKTTKADILPGGATP